VAHLGNSFLSDAFLTHGQVLDEEEIIALSEFNKLEKRLAAKKGKDAGSEGG
jgi:hypothetical protein